MWALVGGVELMWKGLDVFYTEPGVRKRMSCRVCGSECEVDRNAWGPTGYLMAMGKRSVRHDRFFCRYSEEEWHREACDLVLEIQKTRSRRLRELIQKDLEEALARGGFPGPEKAQNEAAQ
jgi:hypothetical protein